MAKAIVNFKTMCKECYIFIAYTEPRSAEVCRYEYRTIVTQTWPSSHLTLDPTSSMLR